MTINVSDMSIKGLRSELRSYGLCTRGYLDKESLVDAVRDARREGLVAECLIAPVPAFLVGRLGSLGDIYRDEDESPQCHNCGDGCACGGEMPLWRDGRFFGMVTAPGGRRKMLHNPRDLVVSPSVGPHSGHLMTNAELESVERTMTFLFSVGGRVVDGFLENFSGKENTEEEDLDRNGKAEIKALAEDVAAGFSGSNYEFCAAMMQLDSVLETKFSQGRWDSDEEVLGFVSFVAGGSGPVSPRMVEEFEMVKEKLEQLGTGKVRPHERNGIFKTPEEAVAAVDELMERLIREKTLLVAEDYGMYPFHSTLKPPFTGAPAPRIRAGDIVEVTFEKELGFDGFVAPAGADVQVYVIAQTAGGKVTGLVQTNKGNHFWLHFDANRTKRMVAKGCNWD